MREIAVLAEAEVARAREIAVFAEAPGGPAEAEVASVREIAVFVEAQVASVREIAVFAEAQVAPRPLERKFVYRCTSVNPCIYMHGASEIRAQRHQEQRHRDDISKAF